MTVVPRDAELTCWLGRAAVHSREEADGVNSTRCVSTHGTSPTAPPELAATFAAVLPVADAPAAALASAAIAFGVRLRTLRQRRGYSQQTLGGEIFYSREYVALVERGLRKPTATFVERAETALHADGQLQREFACVEQARERQARRRAAARRGQRRNDKIRSAVATLRTVHRDEIAAEPSAPWLAAFDELHHVLKGEMEPHDADAEIADLEHRRTDLAARAGGEARWADVAVEAALGVAEAGMLLHRLLSGDHARRLRCVVAAFAALVGDAMMMLGRPAPADDWHRLADAVSDRQVPPPELELPGGAESEPAARADGGSSRLALHGRSAARAACRAGIYGRWPASPRSMVHRRYRRSRQRHFSRGPPRSGPRYVCDLEP
ncbi:helix-turn-helix transcriptional regulator [Dactylosporangium sp. NPDC051485]|uniref:helix-turn-helix domain-containing protein n=1 Tax=Dactylosporangium sp. NPDC051485 TaxID=3154846 RepID=UPI003449FE88